MKKSFIIIAMLLLCVASFALSDMVSLNYADGSRTIPIEDVERIYYSATTDSLDIQLADTNYYYKADADLQITFLDSIEGQHKREREALIAIYETLDGDNWHFNDNWCSDKPLDLWSGVYTNNGYVDYLAIIDKRDIGQRVSLPEEICNLSYLTTLRLENTDVDKLPENIAHSSLKNFYSENNIYITLEDLQPIYAINGLLSIDVRANEFDMWGAGMEIYDMYQQPSPIPDEIFNIYSLEDLGLYGCNLSGEIPEKIGQLTNLRSLQLYNQWGTHMYGPIPKSIGNLKKLSNLTLFNLQLSGGIPEEIYTLNNLSNLTIDCCYIGGELSEKIGDLINLRDLNLRSAGLTGTLPKSLVKLLDNDLGGCMLSYNQLSGEIPQEIVKHPKWAKLWSSIIDGNNFIVNNSIVPVPFFFTEDVFGNMVNSDSIYQNNKYTIIYEFDIAMFPYVSNATYSCHEMHRLYNRYKSYGVDVVMFDGAGYSGPGTKDEAMRNFLSTNQIPWHTIMEEPYYFATIPNVTIVDSNENVVLTTLINMDRQLSFEDIEAFFEQEFPGDAYISTDYSNNMLVDTLQLATKGNGIDIVLMGDAYSDRQIADSTYHQDLQYLYENLFTEEPYKSYKEMFNVFTVNVVSHTEGYEHGSTALGGFFGYETEVGGNDGAVIEYASLAVEYEKLDNAIVIVAMNSDKYAGTCYMYYPAYNNNNYGTGLSISYFPKGGDAATFAQLLHHEALGHGFAKLADEYAYEEYGAVPESTVALHQEQQTNWGWWKNIDFTNDSSEIRWSRLLLDERYQYDGLGAFEGGLTYWTGVWRPTENSIMRYNTGGFNAPSREAIYYRIHKLAYGDEWEYDYEKFVEWDAKNRKTAEIPLLMPSRDKIENFTPTHPPVIKQMSWREAVEQKAQQKFKAMPEERNSTSATTQQGAKIIYTTRK